MSLVEYQEALKMGRKEYHMCVARGKYPYLNVLEEITSNFDVESEVPLGTIQIPMKKNQSKSLLTNSQIEKN